MLVQLIVCVAVFVFIYTANFFENPFCNWVKNEVAYTLNYTINIESAYKSSQEVLQYLAGKIEEGKIYINTSLPQATPDPAVPAAGDAAVPQSTPSPTPLPDLTQNGDPAAGTQQQ